MAELNFAFLLFWVLQLTKPPISELATPRRSAQIVILPTSSNGMVGDKIRSKDLDSENTAVETMLRTRGFPQGTNAPAASEPSRSTSFRFSRYSPPEMRSTQSTPKEQFSQGPGKFSRISPTYSQPMQGSRFQRSTSNPDQLMFRSQSMNSNNPSSRTQRPLVGTSKPGIPDFTTSLKAPESYRPFKNYNPASPTGASSTSNGSPPRGSAGFSSRPTGNRGMPGELKKMESFSPKTMGSGKVVTSKELMAMARQQEAQGKKMPSPKEQNSMWMEVDQRKKTNNWSKL